MKNSFCHKCKLFTNCESPCLPNLTTNSNARLLVVGPFPSVNDDKNKRIFSSSNAKVFLDLLDSKGLQYHITNIIKCTPYKVEEKIVSVRGTDTITRVKVASKPTLTHQKSCLPHFYKLVDEIKPKVIITIGSLVTNSLLDLGLSIDKSRGQAYFHPELDAFIVPVYDLDMIKQDNVYIKHTHDDLNKVKALLDTRGFKKFKSTPRSLKDPMEIETYLKECLTANKLAVDLETTGLNPRADRITDISLCKEAGKGVHIKWKDILPHLNILRDVLKNESILQLGQNYRFDRKFLSHSGIYTHNNYFDTMLGYHTLTMMHEGSGGGLYKLDRLSWLFTHQGNYKSILEQWGGIGNYQESLDSIETPKEVKEKKKSVKATKPTTPKPTARLPIYQDVKMFNRESYEEDIEELVDVEEDDQELVNYACRAEYDYQIGNELITTLMNRVGTRTSVNKVTGQKEVRVKANNNFELDEEEDFKLRQYENIVSKRRLAQLEELGLTPLEYYSAMDADVTFQVAEAIMPLIDKDYKQVYYDLIIPLNRSITIMEEHGILLDTNYVENMITTNKQKMEEASNNIFSITKKEFNISSQDDLREIIYKQLKVKEDPKFMTKGGKSGKKQPSTDQYAIEYFAKTYPKHEEFFNNLLEYRKLEKENSTYFAGFLNCVDPISGRIHGSFLQTTTATGRLSSLQPNLQNIPKASYVRNMVIPSPGHKLVGADLSQAELRILAMVSDDTNMKNAFNSGFDFHAFTAAAMFNIPLKDFDYKNNSRHADLRGIAKCVHPGTLICVDKQIKRIGSVVQHTEYDTFKKVDYQEVWDGTKYIPLKSTYKSIDDERLLVMTRRGAFACSKRHQLKLADGTLVQAQNLVKGDVLAYSPKIEVESKPQYVYYNPVTENSVGGLKLELTPDWAYIAGVFTGDGTASINGLGISTGVQGKYEEWIDSLVHSFNKIGIPVVKRNGVVYESQGNGGVYIGSVRVCRLFDILGLVSYTSHRCARTYRIPEWVLNNKELAWQFLGGLIDTDGTISPDEAITISTKSWELLQDITILLDVLGLEFTTSDEYNEKYNKYYFEVRIRSKHIPLCKEHDILRCPWKRDILRTTTAGSKASCGRIKGPEVLRIENIGIGPLVDLEVDTDEHMYWMAGFEGHNTINFGLAYGRGASSIAEQVNSSVQEAEEFMNKFFKSYPNTKQWMEDTKQTARRTGYVETVHGRRRYLPYINSSDPTKRNHAENQAINTPIQGTASDCACYGLVRITDFVLNNNYKARPCMIIHDEIQMDVPDNEVEIIAKQLPICMTQNIPLITVPLVADSTILDRWEK